MSMLIMIIFIIELSHHQVVRLIMSGIFWGNDYFWYYCNLSIQFITLHQVSDDRQTRPYCVAMLSVNAVYWINLPAYGDQIDYCWIILYHNDFIIFKGSNPSIIVCEREKMNFPHKDSLHWFYSNCWLQ